MLDAWIIEKIRRREEEERRNRYEQPMLEINDEEGYPVGPPPEREKPDETERGVVIINFRV
jgi:hypothetical protein